MNNKTGWIPSLATLLISVAFLYALTAPLLSGDLGWHLRVGQYVLDRHAVPHTNFLSFTCPWFHWLTHEWLTDVLLATVNAAGGLPALFLARGTLFAATLWVLYQLGRKSGAEPLALVALLFLATITLALNVALRPWVVTNLLLVLELYVLGAISTGRLPRSWWWIFPLLFGVWINLHGAYAVGLVVFELTLLSWVAIPHQSPDEPGILRRTATAMLLTTVTLAAMIPNPHGLEALILPFDYLLGEPTTALAGTSAIMEWNPIVLDSFFGGIYLIWCVLSLLAVALSREARRTPATWVGMVFLILTLNAQRHLPIAALLVFPGIARGLLAPLGRRLSTARGGLGRFVAGLSTMESKPRGPFLTIALGALAVWFLFWSHQPSFEARAMAEKHYPLATVQQMASMAPRRLFNHYDWAGLLAWKAPRWPLFITPVSDANPRSVFEDWLSIANLESDWRDKLEAYDVEAVYMPANSALVLALKQDPAWDVTLEDTEAVLLERTSTR